MCDNCSLHGEKGKWYLEQENYILEQLVDEKKINNRKKFLNRFQVNRRKFFTDVMGEGFKEIINSNIHLDLSTIRRQTAKKFIDKYVYYHCSQVVPLEDALKILDKPDKIYLFNCVCSQIYNGTNRESCLCFNTYGEITQQYPDFQVNKFSDNLITGQQAKDLIKKEYANGSVPCLYYYIYPYIGALCSCRLPFCPNLKNRVWENSENGLKKSFYLAYFDYTKCTLCTRKRCIKYCPFNALKIRNNQIEREPGSCTGCGLCRNGCEHNAIRLEFVEGRG